MSSPASRIVIIGAGIGGLTLALLPRRGIIVEILEQAPELRDEPRYSAASGFRGQVPVERPPRRPDPAPCSSTQWHEQSATSTRSGRDDGRPVRRRRSRLGR